MNNRDDRGLVEAVKEGDHRAFETLVRQYQKPIYNVVFRMLHDREESRDVAQSVFLKTFEKIDQYDPERKFFSWVCRIAVNEAINRKARGKSPVARGASAEGVAVGDSRAGADFRGGSPWSSSGWRFDARRVGRRRSR